MNARLRQELKVLAKQGDRAWLASCVDALASVARRFLVPPDRAVELARNAVMALSLGEPDECIREAIDHRVRYWDLDVEDPDGLAEAMALAWRRVTL